MLETENQDLQNTVVLLRHNSKNGDHNRNPEYSQAPIATNIQNDASGYNIPDKSVNLLNSHQNIIHRLYINDIKLQHHLGTQNLKFQIQILELQKELIQFRSSGIQSNIFSQINEQHSMAPHMYEAAQNSAGQQWVPQPYVLQPAPSIVPQHTTQYVPQPLIVPQPTTQYVPQPSIAPQPTTQYVPQPSIVSQPTTQYVPQPSIVPQPTTQYVPQPSIVSQPTTQYVPQPSIVPQPTTQYVPHPSLMYHKPVRYTQQLNVTLPTKAP
ncbi:hypothetical protein DPMN_065335 [Dreissena polymorpha]|uniref:Uncharacterized protein n=1 Tax=Dreissena polymorpha TaxID=45954 RepID=A0A9D4CEV1_DREPO|nr:hypothetical protein DPMN_065335 [Dreissena polymorpha]